ncbi:MAG: hypothetical protein ILM98_14365 [Kiritimatiellae bacterium]|nr:hypothetical protein [Kiritimatiellia bacterium]
MSPHAIFEALMLLSFAASWPFSIAKTLRTHTVAGKSPLFMSIIEAGYVFGILFKLTSPGGPDWRIFLYILNLLIIGFDLALYWRYRDTDRR